MPKPSIVILYTDQQRHDTIRALGAAPMRTPCLDRLAAEGTACTQACPVCLPARWSLHTGLWPSQHGTWSNHHPGPEPAWHLPGLLRAAGWRTAVCGKNHSCLRADDVDLLAERPLPAGPPEPGLTDRLREWYAAAGVPERYPAPARSWPDPDVRLGVLGTARRKRFSGAHSDPAGADLARDPMHRHTDDALQFIAACQADAQPFFLWLSWLYPHTPYHAPDPFASLYAPGELPAPRVEPSGLAAAGKPFRQIFHQRNNDLLLPCTDEDRDAMQRMYAGAVSSIDFQVGRVLDRLDELGLAEDTIVLFTSDHGDYQGDHGLYTKSPALYDCLLRVPLLCRWPGRWRAGQRHAGAVSIVDLLPTLVTACGLAVPPRLPGADLDQLLRRGEWSRRTIFAEYGIPGRPYDAARLAAEQPQWPAQPMDFQGNGVPWEGNPVALAGRIRMVREAGWKLVAEPGGTDELYDVSQDPGELVNRIGDPACTDVLVRLRAELAMWCKDLPGSGH